MQTSILSRLTGALCDAVTGQNDGQATLEQLEGTNLFIVPLDDERRWYRYHHLFSSVLRHYLEQEVGAQGLLPLHQRACDWYAQNGLVEEAFGHALTAEDFDRATNLVEQNAWAMLQRGEASTLLRWFEALPAELLRSRPRLGLFCAWAFFGNLQLNEIEPRLQDAERALQKTPDAGMLGEIDLLRAALTRIQGDAPRAIELHHQALDRIPKDDLDFHGVIASDLGAVQK